jgi:hypothetical protein
VNWTWRVAVPAALVAAGWLFSWRLLNIPSRLETAAFMILLFLIPTLKYPKFGVYYLFSMPLFIPMFRRMYYLVEDRPALDYLMLISDGVMGGFICALALLWLLHKERVRDAMPLLVLAYVALLLVKVFAGNSLDAQSALYGFKFHGLYVMFFFAGSYVLTGFRQTRRVIAFVSWMLLLTAAYGVKQILFGFTAFEQKWMDSITFTTLYIEGVVRPFSTFLSPATLADGMTILLFTGAYWAVSGGRKRMLPGLLLAAAAIWPLLIATVRTNWLAAAAGLAFYLGYLRIRKGWAKGAALAAGMILVVGVLFRSGDGASEYQSAALQSQLSAGNRSVSDIMIRNRTQALANPLKEYSMQKRLQTWSYIWNRAVHQPFGHGTGTTGYAHSFYFQLLGEAGFPGLLLFLAILFLSFRRGFRLIASARDPAVAELARYLVTLVFILSILNLTGTHLHTPPGDIFFWFALGCIHRFHRFHLEEAAAEAEEKAAGGSRGSPVPVPGPAPETGPAPEAGPAAPTPARSLP